jgi:hypothetical protein
MEEYYSKLKEHWISAYALSAYGGCVGATETAYTRSWRIFSSIFGHSRPNDFFTTSAWETLSETYVCDTAH